MWGSPMSTNRQAKCPQRGFSLVETMVGAAIGVLGVVIMMQAFEGAEQRRRATAEGSDAQTSGNIALFTLERDLRMAGYGMHVADALGCTTSTYHADRSPKLQTWTMTPALITDGGDTGSDTLRISFSNQSRFSLPVKTTASLPKTPYSALSLEANFGVVAGDLLVIFEAGKNCALVQASGLVSGSTSGVDFAASATHKWNDSAASQLPTSGYGSGAKVINLGSMLAREYSIDANGRLVVRETTATMPSPDAAVVASGVVDMQVQYGKDTNLADGKNIVDTWNSTTPTTNAEWQQVKAIRVGILARNGEYQKPDVGASACSATTSAPTWSGGSFRVPGGFGESSQARCYRYRVFETSVPLRNLIWSEV